MAAKISKKNTLNIKGTLDLSDGIVKIEVEGKDEPVVFADIAEEYDGLDVKITVDYGQDIV